MNDGSNSYTYDAENRLVSTTAGQSGGTVLSYDPLGRLYQLSGSGVVRQWLYDGDQLTAEYDGAGNLLDTYVHGPGDDDPIVWYPAGEAARWFHRDQHGSIVAIAGSSGSVVGINAYDEYGIPNVSNTGRFQYTGQAWLREIGLYHYKARIYSPTLGRFLQTDPIGYDDQVNLYAYVGNDPVNKTDPTGKESPCVTLGKNCVDPNVTPQQAAGRTLIAASIIAPEVLGSEIVVTATMARGVGFFQKVGSFFGRLFGGGRRAEEAATTIRGTAQATRRGGELTTHGATSERIANEMAASRKYDSVHMNQTVGTITNGEIRSGVRPNVAGVRPDGKVDTVEVLSPGQTAAQMENKLGNALGSRCGIIRCVGPD